MESMSPEELQAIRAFQAETLLDSCRIISVSEGAVDAYNNPTAIETEGAATPCGFRYLRPWELMDQVPGVEAKLRLPHGTAIKTTDKVKITDRYGETISTPWLYEVAGPPEIGVSGVQVLLKRFGK
jgi:hypothetical protein